MSVQKCLFNLPRHHDHWNVFGLGTLPQRLEKDKSLDLGYFNVGDNEIRLFGDGHGKTGLAILGVDDIDVCLGQQIVDVGLVEEVILNYEELQLWHRD